MPTISISRLLTHATDLLPLTSSGRFVDRDMFMRYRGGGVGHKYMREIEAKYENMSLERLHHNSRTKPPQNNTHTGNMGSSNEGPEDLNQESDWSDDNKEEDCVQPGRLQDAQGPKPVGVDGDESSDGDYVPPETSNADDDCSTGRDDDSDDDGPASSEGDSDEIGSDIDYDSHGLADL